MDNRWIIDSDAHVTEPADVWTARVPAKWKNHVPHVVRNDEERDVWMLEGTQIDTVGVTASGINPEGQMVAYKGYEDCPPAAYDSHERLKYMDEVGIWAQVLYPNVAGFGSQKFLDLDCCSARQLKNTTPDLACFRLRWPERMHPRGH